MNWNFPKIITTRNTTQCVGKILEEVSEFIKEREQEEIDKEAIDILHATETFLRVHFEGRENILNEIIEKVFKKNYARGYYTKECF